MPVSTRRINAPIVRLREGANDVLREIFEARTDGEVAGYIGVDASTYSRMQNWASHPGPLFTARLILAARNVAEIKGDELNLSDLFEIVTEDGTTVPLCLNCPEHAADPLLTRQAS